MLQQTVVTLQATLKPSLSVWV